MPAYVIAEVETTNLDEMVRYRDGVLATVEAYGGRFIARGGRVQTLEGGWAPERISVLEFENSERARDWWESEEYRELKALRQHAGRTRMIVLDGV